MPNITELKKAGIIDKNDKLSKEEKAAIESLSKAEMKALLSIKKKIDPSSTANAFNTIIVHHH
jgi:hypothetical protein